MSWPRSPLLMVASSSRTGPAEGQLALARYLRAQGLDARVAADSVKPGDIGEELARAGVPWVRELKLSRHLRPGEVIQDARTLRGWVKQGSPDVLHAAFAHDHLLALWAARGTQALVVRTAHRAADLLPGPLGIRLRALRRSDGVVVHSAESRARLIRAGIAPERLLHLFGGVDSSRFAPGRAPALRAQWGVSEDAPLAGIVARMKPERAHQLLLRAFANVSAPDARLVLVGRGEDEPRLRAIADEVAPGRVIFGGYLRGPGLVDAYRALDVAVWLREGNDGACRGVLEAMACGLPVVAGNQGAPPELVSSTGRVVSDQPELTSALDELLGDLKLARRLGALARARAEGFTHERAGARVLAFWRELHGLRKS